MESHNENIYNNQGPGKKKKYKSQSPFTQLINKFDYFPNNYYGQDRHYKTYNNFQDFPTENNSNQALCKKEEDYCQREYHIVNNKQHNDLSVSHSEFSILPENIKDLLDRNNEKYVYELNDENVVDLETNKLIANSIETHCIVCSNFLIKAMECTDCEKRICEFCYNKIMAKKECPLCRSKQNFKNSSKTFKRVMSVFHIKCPKKCGSVIKYEFYENHIKECKGIIQYKVELEKVIKGASEMNLKLSGEISVLTVRLKKVTKRASEQIFKNLKLSRDISVLTVELEKVTKGASEQNLKLSGEISVLTKKYNINVTFIWVVFFFIVFFAFMFVAAVGFDKPRTRY